MNIGGKRYFGSFTLAFKVNKNHIKKKKKHEANPCPLPPPPNKKSNSQDLPLLNGDWNGRYSVSGSATTNPLEHHYDFFPTQAIFGRGEKPEKFTLSGIVRLKDSVIERSLARFIEANYSACFQPIPIADVLFVKRYQGHQWNYTVDYIATLSLAPERLLKLSGNWKINDKRQATGTFEQTRESKMMWRLIECATGFEN